MPEQTLEQCRESALRIITRREHSESELRQKLQAKGFSADLTEQVVVRLQQTGLLDDMRFAEMFTRSRAQKGYGPMRIRQELKQKGVSGDTGENALSALEVDWFELAKRVRERRFGVNLPQDRKEQAKQWRFMQYRGFDSEQSRFALEVD